MQKHNAMLTPLIGEGKDQVWAGDGNDTLMGEANNDTLWGGAGNDRIAANDAIFVMMQRKGMK